LSSGGLVFGRDACVADEHVGLWQGGLWIAD
jgi:hypothetical protein